MSFKNLEERYNETVDSLYAAAQNKYEDGVRSGGFNDDPLITRRVGDGYWGFGENRSTPVRSSLLDVQRLTKFYVSQRGVLSYAKQQLLQTGNTFEFTRLLNPTFAIGNAVPFLHVRRHLTPKLSLSSITSLVGRTDASSAPVKQWGQMQVKSYERLKSYSKPSFVSDYLKTRVAPSVLVFPETVRGTTNDSVSLGSKFTNRLKSELAAINPFNAVRNIGEEFGYDDEGWTKSRPELAENSIVSIVDLANQKYQTDTDAIIKSLTENVNLLASSPDRQQPFLKYFTAPDDGVITSRGKISNGENAQTLSKDGNTRKKLRYIRDPLNEPANSQNVLEFYKDLHTPQTEYKEDAIIVSFAMGNDDHVQFRAFVRDLTQRVNPEYKPYQYIGRVERFITYTSVEREIDFKLDVLAFSRDELNVVWKRLNYLTGMMFPYGVNRGILQPNVVRFRIGNIFVNQLGYVTSFNMNFNEISESWDIDSQVPIGATINMGIKIIEKNRVTADSPFYGINESREPVVEIGEVELPLGFTSATQVPNNLLPPE